MADRLSCARTALIVVDMQNAYLHPKGSFARLWPEAASEGPGGIDVLNAPVAAGKQFDLTLLRHAIPGCARLIEAARKADVPVIYLTYVYLPDYRDGGVLIGEINPAFKDVGYVAEGTWDAEVVDELKPEPSDIVVEKSRYSGFHGSRLEPVLRSLRAETLVMCGVGTHHCVECTARDAHMRDYRVFIARDATGEANQIWKEASLAAFAHGFGWVVDVADVVEAWRS